MKTGLTEIENTDIELIVKHLQGYEVNDLPERCKAKLERIQSADKLLRKYGKKEKVIFHLQKTFNVSRETARQDLKEMPFVMGEENRFSKNYWTVLLMDSMLADKVKYEKLAERSEDEKTMQKFYELAEKVRGGMVRMHAQIPEDPAISSEDLKLPAISLVFDPTLLPGGPIDRSVLERKMREWNKRTEAEDIDSEQID